jgi:hypothetical protein
MNAGRHPDDPKLSALIGDLSVRSPEFGRLWSSHDVREKRYATKRFYHPLAGEIAIAYEALQPATDNEQILLVSYRRNGLDVRTGYAAPWKLDRRPAARASIRRHSQLED